MPGCRDGKSLVRFKPPEERDQKETRKRIDMKRPFSNSSMFLNTFLLSAAISVLCLAQQSGGEAPTSLDAAARQVVIEEIMKSIKENYLSPEIGEQMNQDLRARLAR